MAVPRSWPVPRKGTKWIQRTSAGPHPQEDSIPLSLVLVDMLGVASSSREARILLREGKVSVDGKAVKDPARGLGLMDVLSLAPPLSKHYRMFMNRLGKLTLIPIPAEEATSKLARIRFKHTVRGGKIALTLHDGRNILVDADSEYRTGDTVRIEVPSQKVISRLPLAPEMLAYVSGGSHVGELARIDHFEVVSSNAPNRVHFKEGFSTVKHYAFIVGEATPVVSMPEGLVK
jgi:small subunit ribosomal protein S4e